MVKAKIIFNDNSTFETNISEDILIEQMNRPQHKRLYTCGIEFSEVEKVEVNDETKRL